MTNDTPRHATACTDSGYAAGTEDCAGGCSERLHRLVAALSQTSRAAVLAQDPSVEAVAMHDAARAVDPDAPHWVELTKPSTARINDYLLGGCSNWDIDREFANRAIRRWPAAKPAAVANRRWLGRVVNAALDAGITQFLDLGCGTASAGAVHELVRARTHRGRVVYVDNEPVAQAHMELALDSLGRSDWVTALREDLRRPDAIFDDPESQDLLDLSRPVCVLMVGVLHFINKETDVPALLDRYRRMVAPGSWLAISHIANDTVPDPDEAARVREFAESYQETQNPMFLRGRNEISSWFTGWRPLDPGLVHPPDWRPDGVEPETDRVGPFAWCGAGVKPED